MNIPTQGGALTLDTYSIVLDPLCAELYRKVAQCAELTTEQVLSDALCHMAGILAAEAILQKVASPLPQ